MQMSSDQTFFLMNLILETRPLDGSRHFYSASAVVPLCVDMFMASDYLLLHRGLFHSSVILISSRIFVRHDRIVSHVGALYELHQIGAATAAAAEAATAATAGLFMNYSWKNTTTLRGRLASHHFISELFYLKKNNFFLLKKETSFMIIVQVEKIIVPIYSRCMLFSYENMIFTIIYSILYSESYEFD